ncbi:MAG: hypothetical protein JOZ27_08290, partial [Caulobacteraceae bacterium]|nr:hypothetical protein [Caulobacteraceae bacterium]
AERLERNWTFRGFLIGGLGLLGGLIGGAQLVGSGLLARVSGLGAGRELQHGVDHLGGVATAWAADHGLGRLGAWGGSSAEALWMSAGLGVVAALGLVVTRALREF